MKMEFIPSLKQTRDQTLSFFELSHADLDKTYSPGKWNVRYLLCHIADAETVFYNRIRRVLSEPRQVIWAFDQDAWAKKLDYDQFPLAISMDIYRSERASIIFLAEKYYLVDGQKDFGHSETEWAH